MKGLGDFLINSKVNIQYLKQKIVAKIEHSYLEKHIKKPAIDERKLQLLVEMVYHTTLSESLKERYIITTMLVQMALDTHDLVPSVTALDEEDEVKLTKQLHVLAGDYYSGLYYLLLAEIDDFDFIRQLASAIKEINEYKMILYYNETSSLTEYMQIQKIIDTLLLVRVAEYLHVPALGEVAGNWLFIKLLTQMFYIIQSHDNSAKIEKWSFPSQLTMVDELKEQLKATMKQLTADLEKIPNHNHLLHQINREITAVGNMNLTMGGEG